jgi:hypothetical protein
MYVQIRVWHNHKSSIKRNRSKMTREQGLKEFEKDCAHALGATYHGKYIGRDSYYAKL